MISRTTPAFRKLLAALPADVQQLARQEFRRFVKDPAHPGLHFKMLQRRGTTLYSARVGLHYRELAYEDDVTLYWFWIGPHAEYDRLLDRL